MSFRIEEVNSSQSDVKNIFSSENPLYSSDLWLRFYENYPIRIFLIYNGNDPVGGFYLHSFRKWGFHILSNPLYCPSNGFILNCNKKEGYLKNTFVKEAHEATALFLQKELRPSILFSAFPAWVHNVQPYHWASMKCSPNYTYLLDLTKGENDWLQRCSNKVRKCLSLSDKEFYFDSEVASDEMLRLLEITYLRNGKKYPLEIPRKMMEQSPPKKIIKVAARRKSDHTAVAFAFSLHDNETVYQLFNGYNHEIPSSQTVKACFYLSIKESFKRGLKWFDFEGSMIPHVEKGVREFGGNVVPYYTIAWTRRWLRIPACVLFPRRF